MPLCAGHVNHVPILRENKTCTGGDTFVELLTDKVYSAALDQFTNTRSEMFLLLLGQFIDVLAYCFVYLSRPSPSHAYFNGLKSVMTAQNVGFCYVFLLGTSNWLKANFPAWDVQELAAVVSNQNVKRTVAEEPPHNDQAVVEAILVRPTEFVVVLHQPNNTVGTEALHRRLNFSGVNIPEFLLEYGRLVYCAKSLLFSVHYTKSSQYRGVKLSRVNHFPILPDLSLLSHGSCS